MALRHAVLAALLDGDTSGYELARRFDVSVANFWSTTPQQLYRELERMAGEGLVAGRLVEQRGRPNKRVFALTDAGRATLRAFTARPAKPTAIRDELLVKLAAVDAGDRDAVCAALENRIRDAREKLDRYRKLRADALAGRSEEEFLDASARVGPYLTLLGGIAFEEEGIRWAETVLEALRRRVTSRATTEAQRRSHGSAAPSVLDREASPPR